MCHCCSPLHGIPSRIRILALNSSRTDNATFPTSGYRCALLSARSALGRSCLFCLYGWCRLLGIATSLILMLLLLLTSSASSSWPTPLLLFSSSITTPPSAFIFLILHACVSLSLKLMLNRSVSVSAASPPSSSQHSMTAVFRIPPTWLVVGWLVGVLFGWRYIAVGHFLIEGVFLGALWPC